MAKNYFKRYIWLIELLQSYSMLSLDQIKAFWMSSSVNDDGKPLADRTFFNTVDSIRDMFGIDIVCNRSTNEYYIENEDDIKGSGIRNWMMNALSLNNILSESASMKDRILFEDVPSGQRFLVPVMKAMKEGHMIQVKYKSFRKENIDDRYLNPFCLKSFDHRWYLLASSDENPEPHIYALDRMIEARESVRESNIPEDFSAEAYFAPFIGFPLGSESSEKPVNVRLKVNRYQRDYFRTLPLHASQEEVETNGDYSVFSYRLIPNSFLKRQIISYLGAVEVLEPQSLRKEIVESLTKALKKYE